jgi:DNA invertase Pin-like site-specific DNA recombinase
MSEKYILYARKSTDVEDKQVLSIEAQLIELRAYARNENLQIIDELIEKQSAKVPGRPVFSSMLKRIEAGEANGVIAWHPDRLARNSIDGGQIIYLLDQTRLNSLKFPSFWFENTSQGKFMLSIAFGQSKYYVDNLSENTKRGLRQKVRRGEMPGRAPLGYINDVRTKTVIVDKRRASFVVEAFELYAKDQSRLQDISAFISQGQPIDFAGLVKQSALKNSKNQAELMINIKRFKDREITSYNLISNLRSKIQDSCQKKYEATIKFIELPAGPPVLASLVLKFLVHQYVSVHHMLDEKMVSSQHKSFQYI